VPAISKRFLLAAFVVLLWATPAVAQFTLIGADAETCVGVTTCQPATGIAAQAGDLLTMAVGNRNAGATLTGVSDGTNGAWTCPAGAYIIDGPVTTAVCYFINSGAATLQPTATINAANTIYVYFQVWRPTVAGASVTVDDDAEVSGVSSPHALSVPLSTGANAQLAVFAATHSGAATSCTATSGQTFAATEGRACFFYDATGMQSTTHDGAYTSVGGFSASLVAVSFNDAAVAATAPRCLMTLGVSGCD
jgi:hypothetical protein